MTFSFTVHAIDRYVQFHLMANQNHQTENEAKRALIEHADKAYKLKDKTKRGDTIWRIDELGIDLVTKHEDGIEIVVTILPPPWFRGLTPLQAEIASKRSAEAEKRVSELNANMFLNPQDGYLKYHRDIAMAERDIQQYALKVMRTQLGSKLYEEIRELYALHPEFKDRK